METAHLTRKIVNLPIILHHLHNVIQRRSIINHYGENGTLPPIHIV